MKYKTIAFIAVILMPVAQAFAGPFHTTIIIGTGASYDYSLVVPARRAVTITSFLMFNQAGDSSQVASITVTTDDPAPATSAIRLLYSASPDATSTEKDVTIAGPAKIQVNVPHVGYQALLTYRIIAN